MALRLFYQGTRYRIRNTSAVLRWIRKVIQTEGQRADEISFIICTDAILLPMNQQYLRHNTLTDIITFPFHAKGDPLAGEIYISIDRVRENAKAFEVRQQDELHRVMVHGILHLAGYRDKTRGQKAQMRKKEDAYLSLRKGST